MSKAVTFAESGDDADDLTEAVEDLREEQQEIFLAMTLQALHDDSVSFATWSLPSGMTAYLVGSWNGVTELFAIDENGYSDERAATLVITYIRSAFIDSRAEPGGPEELLISPLDVEVYLKTRTPEIDLLVKWGEV